MTCMSGWLALWVRASHCVIVTCHYSCSRGRRSNWRPKVMRNNMSFEDTITCHMTHRGHFWRYFYYIQPTKTEDEISVLSIQQRMWRNLYTFIKRRSKNKRYLKAGPVQIQRSKVTLNPEEVHKRNEIDFLLTSLSLPLVCLEVVPLLISG